MLHKMVAELLKELRNAGHEVRVSADKVIVREGRAHALSPKQRNSIRGLKPQLLWILQDEALRAAFIAAVDEIADGWPGGGPAPVPDLEVIAREAAVDVAMKAEPQDFTAAMEAIRQWKVAWIACVRAWKER